MIQVAGIHKRYGSVTALEDVTFSVAPGETFGIIGPNGAGKTTLLKILLGLVHPDRGSVSVAGTDLLADPGTVRARMGYVPQRAAFEETATGREALTFLARLRRVPEEEAEARARLVDVEDLLERRIGTLSGGQRQRLSLAASLLGDPPVLLLDEPTASLDPQATAAFRNLLERLGREGRTILLSSHLLADVERLCDRVLVLLDGRVAAIETLVGPAASALYLDVQDPERARRVAGEMQVTLLAADEGRLKAEVSGEDQIRLLLGLAHGGVRIRSLETRRPTLEERFLAALTPGGDHAP